jgi:D-glycero-alpha-D-manno-heptose 1-phosphate guanylyltransferase
MRAHDRISDLTAVILAGGLGTRLRATVPDRPKVLAPVGGRPFLAFLLDRLVAANISHAVLAVGYRGEQVVNVFGSRYGPLALSYAHEETLLGTGGALRHALPLVRSDPVLVLNGDSYCAVDLDQFAMWHRQARSPGALAVTWVPDARRFGSVAATDDGTITAFVEKSASGPVSVPVGTDAGAGGWVNAGIYLLSHELLQSIPTGRPVSLEHDTFPAWIGRGLRGFRTDAELLDIGTKPSYDGAPETLQRIQTKI